MDGAPRFVQLARIQLRNREISRFGLISEDLIEGASPPELRGVSRTFAATPEQRPG